MRDIRTSAERFIRVVQSDLVDGSGEQRYRFETDSDQTFAIKDDGAFDSTFIPVGDVQRSFSNNVVEFKNFENSIIMINESSSGGSGSSNRTVTYSLCTTDN